MTGAAGLEVRLRQDAPIALDAALACAPGEVLALVGPSGSGKSTVLRCIAGLHRPAAGLIRCQGQTWLDGQAGIHLPPQRRRVGMVFQSFALFPHLTALDNVALALTHLPAPQRPAAARALLERVHLGGLDARRPAALSGGQQQRVALARALARDPAVLLLDEPFSAVDQVTRRKLRLELAGLTRSLPIPIVFVTHDLDEAAMLAHRLCVMHAGRTLQAGTPEEVLHAPADATVARLMDARNLFAGEIAGHLPGRGLTVLGWQGRRLEVRLHPQFPPGSRVHWMVPPGSLLLHRRGRPPSQGERENPLHGRIVELLTLSGLTTVILRLADAGDVRLTMELPPHVVRRNGLALGQDIGVSLVGENVHLMPWRPVRREE
ncbi:MAG: ABC transporter ATP-binding protein [Pseudomonadota bacterium]|nr:ABC transporter ATP-binding protein [Pseudomonadota bacterium]